MPLVAGGKMVCASDSQSSVSLCVGDIGDCKSIQTLIEFQMFIL